jgi:DNA polymerase III subunit delta
MNHLSVVADWKKNIFKPLYWLEGEEEFFIDEIIEYAEKKILPPEEASFNQVVFYGKDANWADIINACRRYPMFAERQLVLLKEAQHMKDIDKLEAYFENPSPTTILVVAYKGKTIDGRMKLAKILKNKAVVFHSKKIYDNQLPGWVSSYVQSQNLQITPAALQLLVTHVGNDLSRLVNEISKLTMNLGEENKITEDHIEKYIGVSKEYNLFELQHAYSKKDLAKAIRISQYFEANPKAVPVPMILPSIYGYFTKIMTVHQMPDKSERVLRPLFFNNPSLIQQATDTLRNYSFAETEKIILLLHEYNLKNIGIRNNGTSMGSLMKELSYKIIMGN